MRRVDAAAADVEGRRDHGVDAQLLEREDRSDDVDDRIDRPHLVEVDALERQAVNAGLHLAEPQEQGFGASLGRRTERGPIDECVNLGQGTMVVAVRVRRRVLGMPVAMPGLALDAELRCCDACPRHRLGPHHLRIDGEAAEGRADIGERDPGVDEGSEHHVARCA
jgi:hypothetical protein